MLTLHADRCDLQLPVRRGTLKSVNHAINLQDLFRQLFNHSRTLEDLGITEERSKQIMSATIDAWRESKSFRASMRTLIFYIAPARKKLQRPPGACMLMHACISIQRAVTLRRVAASYGALKAL